MYYLRDRTGKSARIAEKIRKKIGIDVNVKPETVTEKNAAPVAETPPAETSKKEVPITEALKDEQKSEGSSEKK